MDDFGSYMQVRLEDLKIGDIFCWIKTSTGKPQSDKFRVTKLPDRDGRFGFVDIKNSFRYWTHHQMAPSEENRLIRFSQNKDDSIIAKIKYLDKRFAERKANVQSMA